MGELLCPGCGNEVPPSQGSRPRKWCSKSCRTRQYAMNASLRVPVDEKCCNACEVVKPASEFHASRASKDGLQSRCRDCRSEQERVGDALTKKRTRSRRHDRRMRREAPEPRRAFDRDRYWADPEAARERVREQRRKDPRKHRARAKLARAVATGRLVRPEACEHCGGGGPIEAHHEDYSKPLDVQWLCRSCHGMEHWIAEEAA